MTRDSGGSAPGSGDTPPRIRPAGGRLIPAVTAAALFVLVIVLAVILLRMLLARQPDSPQVSTPETPAFEVVLVIDGPGTGEMPDFERPLSAAFDSSGRIYVSDTGNARICVFRGDGEFLREIVVPSSEDLPAPPRLVQPAGVTVSDDGEVYVADVGAGVVFVLDPSGELLRTIIPAAGERLQGAWSPTDVAVIGDRVFVTDATGVAVFDAEEGVPVTRLEQEGDRVTYSRPNGIGRGAEDSVVVSDTNAQRVLSMGTDGTLRWAVEPSSGSQPFGLPRGLATAQDGSVLVADAFKFGIALVRSEGEFLQTMGERGTVPGAFEYPNDVDARGDLALVTDKDNDRVQVLRLNILAEE